MKSFNPASLVPRVVAVIVAMMSPALFAQNLPPVMDEMRAAEQLEPDLDRSTGKVVLLHFWASWCIPCRDEMNSLAEFWRHEYPELAEDGLRVVTISNDVRDKDLERFASEFELAFPLYYDPYSRLTSRYGVRGLPSTVVLDADGNVVEQILGGQDWLATGFIQRLRSLLSGGDGIRRDQELDLKVRYNPAR
ncbi:MAG: TlpA disulfide reductase family protein [Wenzhouxiangellaceae bacterium]